MIESVDFVVLYLQVFAAFCPHQQKSGQHQKNHSTPFKVSKFARSLLLPDTELPWKLILPGLVLVHAKITHDMISSVKLEESLEYSDKISSRIQNVASQMHTSATSPFRTNELTSPFRTYELCGYPLANPYPGWPPDRGVGHKL